MQDEATLIHALKQRDPAALATLFERYADRVYRLAVNILHDEQQADGVVQNTFLALIEHVSTFEARAKIGTWLYRVAYNECMMRIRSAKPDIELDAADEGSVMPVSFVDWNTLPEQVISSAEAAAEMQRAIAGLKPDLRVVFTLRDIEELSTHETAHVLGISESAVKVRLHRARLALREKLATYFEERVRV